MSFCLLHEVIIKEDNIVKCKQAPQSSQTRQTYFENSSNLYEYFLENTFLKKNHALNTVSRLFHTLKFQMMVKVVWHLPKSDAIVHRCFMEKLFR